MCSFEVVQDFFGLTRILIETGVNGSRYLIVTKCEVVSPALEMELKTEVKTEEAGILLKPKQETDVNNEITRETTGFNLKPKQEMVSRSVAQIVHEQRGK